MQTKIKNRWKIVGLILFVLIIIFGGGRLRQAQAANFEGCLNERGRCLNWKKVEDTSKEPGKSCQTEFTSAGKAFDEASYKANFYDACTKCSNMGSDVVGGEIYEVRCFTNTPDPKDAWYCAQSAELPSSGMISRRYVVCRQIRDDVNQCNLDLDPNCQGCEYKPLRAYPGVSDQAVHFEGTVPVGCEQGVSCNLDPVNNIGVCVEKQNLCAGGLGVDEDLKETYCPEPDKPCAHKMEADEFFVFLATKAIDVTRGNDWSGEKNLHIEAKTKAYCSKFGDEIDPANCFLGADKYLQHSTDPQNTLPYIGNVYNDQDQTKIKDAFGPHYECKGEGVTGWLKRLGWGIFNSTIGTAVALVMGIVLSFVTFIMGFLLWTVTALLEWAIGISQMDMGIIDVVWRFLRDFSNMFFIIILLYIAFCTVLRIQSQNMKRLLPAFLVGTILINFSKLLCQLVIDFAQVLIDGFYNLRPLGTWGVITHLLEVGGISKGFGVADLIGKTEMKDLMGVIGSQGLMVLYMFAAILTFGVAAILLVIRIVTLWILTAISPLVYVAMAVGQSGLVKKYWNYFLRTALFAPALIFCILLSLVVLNHDVPKSDYIESRAGEAAEILEGPVTQEKIPIQAGSFPRFIQMVFALAFIWAGIFVAKKSGVMGSAAIVGAAEKGFKKVAPWVTGAKPAGYGLRALGRYGWERGLRSKYGGKLKWLSPKTWKETYKRHQEKVELETYGPRVAELQERISGWEGFFHKRGPAYERERFFAQAQQMREVKKFLNTMIQADRPTEDVYTVFTDNNLDIAKAKGLLGSEMALTPDAEAAELLYSIRGDDNDKLKTSRYGKWITGGRATMGMDLKYDKRLYGSAPRVVQLANMKGEAAKGRYLQFSYIAGTDEAESLTTADEDESLRKVELEEGEEPSRELRFNIDYEVFQKYIRQKAAKLGVAYDELYDMTIENLGLTRNQILNADGKDDHFRKAALADIKKRKQKKRIAEDADEDKLLHGIASVVATYNKNRNALIRSELAKKGSRAFFTGHPTSTFGLTDMPRSAFTEAEEKRYKNAPATVKYFGVSPNSRGALESLDWIHGERVMSWADSRTVEAVRYKENAKDLLKLAYDIDQENAEEGITTETYDKLRLLLRNVRADVEAVESELLEEGAITEERVHQSQESERGGRRRPTGRYTREAEEAAAAEEAEEAERAEAEAEEAEETEGST